MPDAGTIPFRKADTNGHYKSLQLPNDAAEFMPALGLPAFAGDVVGPGGATVNQVAVFENATGKKIRAAVETGLAKLSGGVLSSVTAPVGEVVGTTDPQVLTNKTLTNPTITGLTGLTKNDVGLGNVDNTSDANKPVSGPQQAALNLKQDLAAKAAANGYASLDAAAKVPLAQIPDSVLGGQQYQGTWNAATNTPAIPTAVLGNKGWYYSVNVAGTTNINGISSWAVGDQIISNGSVWQKIANVSAVNSVNGYTGVVVLGKADVGLGNVDNTSDAAKPVSTATATQLTLKEDKANKNVANGYAGLDATGKVPAANVPADLVTSVAAKQGVVTLVKGDVGLGNVDNTSDATYSASSATLTNKTINGANNTLTVRLANDVTGNFPVTNLNAGTGANSGSFWRGDGQWAPPAGGGDVVGPALAVDNDVAVFSGTTGKVLKTLGAPLGPASAVDSEVSLFSGTTGKSFKRATGTGYVTVVNGVYQTPAAVPLPRSYLSGFEISNNATDAANDVDVAVGECRNSTNTENIVLSSVLVKRLDATFVAGTNQGGREIGSTLTVTTWHVFAIKNVSSGVVDVMFSATLVPVLPSGFTVYRRIASVVYKTGTIQAFFQVGDYFQLAVSTTDLNDSQMTTGQAYVQPLPSVPTGFKVLADVLVQGFHSTGIMQVFVGDGGAASNRAIMISTPSANITSTTHGMVWTNIDASIRESAGYQSVNGIYHVTITVHGWWDYRNKN